MKVLLVGARGVLGRAIGEALTGRHEIIAAGRSHSDVPVDITDTSSIDAMYRAVGIVDAVVCAAGDAHFGALVTTRYDDFMIGIKSKLMGQISLVMRGFEYLSDGGSFTLTSGITERDPVVNLVNSATVNAALGGFVLGASIEMPRRQRINVVSPPLFAESVERYGHLFPGHVPVPVSIVAQAFVKSIEGAINGQKIIV